VLNVLLDTTTTADLKESYGNLIFLGLFVLAAIAAGIWWLRRG
jgi:hypothetical protein